MNGADAAVHETCAENESVTVPETATVTTTELVFAESVASTLVTAAPALHVPSPAAGGVVAVVVVEVVVARAGVVVVVVVAAGGAGADVFAEPAEGPKPTVVKPLTVPPHVPTMTFAPLGIADVAVMVP